MAGDRLFGGLTFKWFGFDMLSRTFKQHKEHNIQHLTAGFRIWRETETGTLSSLTGPVG